MSNQTSPLKRSVLSFLLPLVCSGAFAACGEDTPAEESFDNLPDCVLDHAGLGEPEAIAHCLVDFPELHGGTDFADQQACVDFVTANGGYPDSSEDACTDYFTELGAP